MSGVRIETFTQNPPIILLKSVALPGSTNHAVNSIIVLMPNSDRAVMDKAAMVMVIRVMRLSIFIAYPPFTYNTTPASQNTYT
jgi:hypothetical protein